MSVVQVLTGLFKPAADLIDALHTSEEEKLNLRTVWVTIQAGVITQVLELEAKLAEWQGKIIIAETQSQSWLTRNWRPLTMVSFVVAILSHWYGLTPDTLTEEQVQSMYTLVTLGITGYIGGRSIEKAAGSVAKILRDKDNT